MNVIKFFTFFVGLTFLACFAMSVSYAQSGPTVNQIPPTTTDDPIPPTSDGTSIKLQNPIKSNSLPCFVSDILKIAVDLGALVAVLFIIYSGFLFITAQGDTGKLKLARTTFFTTIIGTGILLGAWVIAVAITGTINQVTGSNITVQSCT